MIMKPLIWVQLVIYKMDFSDALIGLKENSKLTRKGWNGKGMWIELQTPDENSKMTKPYVYMCIPKGSTKQFGDESKETDRIPWLVSQTDLLAEDWECMGGK